MPLTLPVESADVVGLLKVSSIRKRKVTGIERVTAAATSSDNAPMNTRERYLTRYGSSRRRMDQLDSFTVSLSPAAFFSPAVFLSPGAFPPPGALALSLLPMCLEEAGSDEAVITRALVNTIKSSV